MFFFDRKRFLVDDCGLVLMILLVIPRGPVVLLRPMFPTYSILRREHRIFLLIIVVK
jgi:hypothetical protein